MARSRSSSASRAASTRSPPRRSRPAPRRSSWRSISSPARPRADPACPHPRRSGRRRPPHRPGRRGMREESVALGRPEDECDMTDLTEERLAEPIATLAPAPPGWVRLPSSPPGAARRGAASPPTDIGRSVPGTRPRTDVDQSNDIGSERPSPARELMSRLSTRPAAWPACVPWSRVVRQRSLRRAHRARAGRGQRRGVGTQSASSTAFSTWSRVVSKTGTGESPGPTSRSISVQPRRMPSAPRRARSFMIRR